MNGSGHRKKSYIVVTVIIARKSVLYSNEAVLPIYILHQTVIVIVTFFVIELSLSILPALFLVIIMSSFGSVIIYDLIVKRIKWVRFLFGMRALVR